MRSLSKIMLACLGLFALSSCNLGFSDPNVQINTIENENTNVIQVQNELTKTIEEVSKSAVGIRVSAGNRAAIGSGVIYKAIDEDTDKTMTSETQIALCYVVTNEHVVNLDGDKQTSYRVYVGEDTYYKADLLGSDPVNDLAVLTFKCPVNTEGLQPIKGFYNKDGEETITDIAKVGSYVVAIGCPLDLDNFNYPTFGLVGKVSLNAINHSAPINPGNSGGGLFNTSGRLIGINVSKMTTITETDENGNIIEVPIDGIGEAIPVWTVRSVVEDIEASHTVIERPQLGITVTNLNATLNDEDYDKLPNNQVAGIYIQAVEPLGNGVKLNGVDEQDNKYNGLKAGDIIYKINDNIVSRSDELKYYLNDMIVGDKVTLVVYRKVVDNLDNTLDRWEMITFSGILG